MASQASKNRLQKAFLKNSRIPFTLPLGGKIRMGKVILRGQVVLSAGTTNGTVKGEGGPLNLISRIIVTATSANGRYPGGKIVDATPRALVRNAITQRNGKLAIDLLGATLGSGAAGTYQVYTSIPIYFADYVQRGPLTTALNTDPGAFASVQVEVQTGDITSCFTGNDRTVDYSGLTIEWVDERVNVGGDTAVLFQESHVAYIAATNARMLDEAMPQDGNFMSWQVCAEQSAALNLSNGLLNKIVIAGPVLDFEKKAYDIQQTMVDDEWVDGSTTLTGFYFIDFTDGTVQANSIPAGTLQTYFDVTNVSGANLDDLEVFTRRVYAPAAAK